MRIRMILTVIVLAAVLAIAPLFSGNASHAQDQGGDNAIILSKLDQVLSQQRSILDQITAMKSELNIIKIRVTQAQ